MFDLYSFLRLLFAAWPSILTGLLVVFFCILIIWAKWPRWVRVVTILATVACLVVFGSSLYFEYFIGMLGDEDDAKAEIAFNYLKPSFSDRRLKHELEKGRQDANEQFYLALMAAQRSLHVPRAKLVRKPGFFRINNYNVF